MTITADAITSDLNRMNYLFKQMGGVELLQAWYDKQEEAGVKVTGTMIMEARRSIEIDLELREVS